MNKFGLRGDSFGIFVVRCVPIVRELATEYSEDKELYEIFFVDKKGVSGLGIGFWLRGVQPRTTMRWRRGACRSTNPIN